MVSWGERNEQRTAAMPDPVTRAVAVLNEALERDPEAMRQLINFRAECNSSLAQHPFIQVSQYDGVYRIGLLGLINGLLADSPTGAIGCKGMMDEKTGRFARITKFVDLRGEKLDLLA